MYNLFVGAHPDDVEIHCGGTMLKMLDNGERVGVWIFTNGECRNGDRVSEQEAVSKYMRVELKMLGYEDGTVKLSNEMVASIDTLIKQDLPSRVFVHGPDDLHQDHIAVSKIMIVANRHKMFDLYYYPPTDVTADFKTNVFEDITKYHEKKMLSLQLFTSQQDRWYMQTEKLVPFAKHIERFQVQFMKGIL